MGEAELRREIRDLRDDLERLREMASPLTRWSRPRSGKVGRYPIGCKITAVNSGGASYDVIEIESDGDTIYPNIAHAAVPNIGDATLVVGDKVPLFYNAEDKELFLARRVKVQLYDYIDLRVIADAYIVEIQPDENFDGLPLQIQRPSGPGGRKWAYLRCDWSLHPDLEEYPIVIFWAYTLERGGGPSLELRIPLAPTTWDETTLTWNNRPPYSATVREFTNSTTGWNSSELEPELVSPDDMELGVIIRPAVQQVGVYATLEDRGGDNFPFYRFGKTRGDMAILNPDDFPYSGV